MMPWPPPAAAIAPPPDRPAIHHRPPGHADRTLNRAAIAKDPHVVTGTPFHHLPRCWPAPAPAPSLPGRRAPRRHPAMNPAPADGRTCDNLSCLQPVQSASGQPCQTPRNGASYHIITRRTPVIHGAFLPFHPRPPDFPAQNHTLPIHPSPLSFQHHPSQTEPYTTLPVLP
jgi:hypothetical protein